MGNGGSGQRTGHDKERGKFEVPHFDGGRRS